MLRGLTTNFFADDLTEASAWYTEVFGVEPYFVRPVEGPPAYIEYRIGDYLHEFGLLHSRYARHDVAHGPAGAVVDPFGNVLGLMYNPHYLEILAGR